MFCAKCGAQISESDQFCPKCGKENINYVKSLNETRVNTAEENPELQSTPADSNNSHAKKRTGILAVVIVGAVVVIGVLCFILFGNKGSNPFPSANSKVAWSPKGIGGYIDGEGAVHFVDAGEVKSFEGNIKTGRSTPDHTKYLVLSEDGVLQLYELQDGTYTPTTIADKAEGILAISNDGCFYTATSSNHLFYYGFADKNAVDTGLENCSFEYSQNRNTVIGVKESGEISIFTKGDSSSKALCNVDSEADICCVADDGSNVIWGVKDGNAFSIYMLKNGAPERIGKITNSEKYSYVYGFFFNNDKSFIIYSNGSAQMILGNKNGEIKELALPGVKDYGSFFDHNGQYIDSDDDNIEEPYLLIKKTKNSNTGGLYKLTKEGGFSLEADDINLDSAWYYTTSYYIRNGTVYYINKDGDLYKKQLGEGNETISITTDVKALYIPEAGKYAYIVKAGSLYYIDLSDKDHKLNMIWNKLSEDDTIQLTDKPDVLYFISDMQEISDSYRTKGTLFRYVIGSEPKEIAKNIMYIQSGDSKSVSADHPIFEQYVSHVKYDYTINVGTCSEGEYKELIQSVKD